MIESISKNSFGLPSAVKQKNGGEAVTPDFSERLKAMLTDVNQKQHTADDSIKKVINGEMDIHDGMISVTEADISLRYLIQVRAKVMQAYNEIIKMQI
jgi:flagellar hook-basal body complex protein FliE